MPVVVEGEAVVEDVLDACLPAVAALVRCHAVDNGLVGNLLQVEVEGSVDAQAGLMHLFAAEALLQLAPHLLLEPGGDGALGLGNMQVEPGLQGAFRLSVRNYPHPTPFP